MEGSEDNSDNSVDYSGGSEDNFSGNSTDYLDEAILERSNSLLEDRAVLLSPPQTESLEARR